MENQLLFQAYGNEGIIAECRYALLRLAGGCFPAQDGLQVIVYTDQPEAFTLFTNKLPLQLRELPATRLAAWRGTINFVHRVKIELIKDALSRSSGKLLYADTDTFCLQPIEALFAAVGPDRVFMHTNEGLLSHPPTPHLKKWKQFLQTHPGIVSGSLAPLQASMWNAGIIGIQHSHLPLVEKVLHLTDTLYPLFPRHTVEQFAFGYTFQNEGISIQSAHPYFFHYWNLKEFRLVLLSFFEKHRQSSFEEMLIAARQLQPEVILQSKLQYENSPALRKIFIKMMGKKWTIDPFLP